MAEKEQQRKETHRVYSVIKREGQDDFWLNLGLVFPHKDGDGFNIMLQAMPAPTGDGQYKIVCRAIHEGDDTAEGTQEAARGEPQRRRTGSSR